ncbi:MAG: class I SAM-dependent methyltransferase [Myxococcota bacterium]
MASEKIPVELGAVQETLLIPLLGRAFETERSNGLITDRRAVEIVSTLDYDFDKWRSGSSRSTLSGAALRTRLFDLVVEDFLQKNPEGTVVEIGCGLNTRFERLDNGKAHWIDLDLPDTIALRRRFFDEAPRRIMIAASVLDTAWLDEVQATGGPWVFISEAVMIYLEPPQARQAIEQIGAKFDAFSLVVDTVDRKMIERQGRSGPMKELPRESWFRWECNDPREIETWVAGLRLVDSRTFVDAPPELVARMPNPYRPLVKFTPWLMRWALRGYWLNVFERKGG